MSDTLVYSTDGGRVSPKKGEKKETIPKGDGIVRIERQTKGRKGKGVTIVRGLSLPAAELKTLAKELKKRCATGGTVVDYAIEIQGDKRDVIKDVLEKKGFRVKLAGG